MASDEDDDGGLVAAADDRSNADDMDEEDKKEDSGEPSAANDDDDDGNQKDDSVVGSSAMRPIFLGNLNLGYTAEEVVRVFETPILPPDLGDDEAAKYKPMPVKRIDHKRGYCFVFLQDAETQSDKGRIQDYVKLINGM